MIFPMKSPCLLVIYPLVNIQKTMEKHHFLMGKSTINDPCSMAMLVYQRVYIYILKDRGIHILFVQDIQDGWSLDNFQAYNFSISVWFHVNSEHYHPYDWLTSINNTKCNSPLCWLDYKKEPQTIGKLVSKPPVLLDAAWPNAIWHLAVLVWVPFQALLA